MKPVLRHMPHPSGLPLSRAVIVGHIAYLSGQVAADAQGRLVGNDVTTQTRHVLESIQQTLAELGAGMADAFCAAKLLARVLGAWRAAAAVEAACARLLRHGAEQRLLRRALRGWRSAAEAAAPHALLRDFATWRANARTRRLLRAFRAAKSPGDVFLSPPAPGQRGGLGLGQGLGRRLALKGAAARETTAAADAAAAAAAAAGDEPRSLAPSLAASPEDVPPPRADGL